MNQYTLILKKCSLFANINENDFPKLLACVNASNRELEVGETLFLAGDQVNYVGVVLRGALAIHKENPAGIAHLLDFVEPAHLFGEVIAGTKDRVSPVTVCAKEPSTVLLIPYERIIITCGHACSFHQQIIKNMLMLVSEKNRKLNYKLELLALKGMREKLATYLLYESKKHGSLTFQILPNRSELAEYLNVSRSSMCRELGRMKDLGMIDFYQNSFRILSKDDLTRCIS
jgi:CRP-like cAMP-binding protein